MNGRSPDLPFVRHATAFIQPDVRKKVIINMVDNNDDKLRVPLIEEELDVQVRQRQEGVVRFTKRIETDHVATDIDVRSDDLFIERVPRDDVVTEARQPWHDGDTLVIPVYEERLVVEKRLVLTEEIRVLRRVKTEQVTVEDDLRREIVDIESEQLPDTN